LLFNRLERFQDLALRLLKQVKRALALKILSGRVLTLP
jgi:hypothetical protein